MKADAGGNRMFDCHSCQTPGHVMYRDEERRRSWHCGWIEHDEWSSPHRLPLAPPVAKIVCCDDAGERLPDDRVVCPGWLLSQDEVLEGARAYRAFDKGALTDLFPNLEHSVVEAAEFFAGVVAEYQDSELAKAKNG